MESIIQRALKLLLDKFEADYDIVTVTEEDGQYRANIETSAPARIIGRNGMVLAALQTLLRQVLYAQQKEHILLSVDVDGYRRDQEQRVIDKAEDFIQQMKDQNLAEIKLPPSKPYFRRVVHLYIAHNHPELDSDSTGEGRARAVRVFHK